MRSFFLLFLLVLITGCSAKKGGDEISFQIKTTETTNHGTPLYVVIKETRMEEFLTQDYQEISAQSFWKQENPSYLVRKVLVPGTTHTIKLKAPEENSLGLYFLFTDPGECWRYVVDSPKNQKVKILLGENEYKAVNVFGE